MNHWKNFKNIFGFKILQLKVKKMFKLSFYNLLNLLYFIVYTTLKYWWYKYIMVINFKQIMKTSVMFLYFYIVIRYILFM